MGIYRGTGGTGDSTTDATINEVTQQAVNAATSATDAASSASAASSSASTSDTNATNAATSETNAATSATAAATSANNAANSLTSFQGQYVSQSTAPSSPTTGDLWFDETASTMKVYNSTSWVNTGTVINGVENSVEHTATAGQTTFTATYDVGFLQVFLNGIRLDAADYTATNGTTVVLGSGAAVNDVIFIHSFGTFQLADHYTKTAADTLLAAKVDDSQVLTDVPSGALFTDTNTTYSVGDGGLTEKNFTSADNTKLDGIAASANNYSHPTQHVTADIADGAITQAKIDPTVALGGPSLGTDSVIRTNAKTIAENITFAGTENGMSIGPITVNSGYTVTVTSGSTWVVL